ncbi:SMI1/KNR4 family protein [Methylopila sp. M107]|uniref:SMI1/KNR4 family protein n=1 Tax=Methylopila sp. M107 TaxID=1101190 RepID=UPI0003660557|nr:SMI1/KNR4 family protein [Methylopila sp. M107]
MSIPALDVSNVAALIAAFRIANAPGPARPADAASGPDARPHRPTPSTPQTPRNAAEGAAASLWPTGGADGPDGPHRPPEPATRVTISSSIRPPTIAPDPAPLAQILDDARQALDAIYRAAAGGDRLAAALIRRQPSEPLLALLDRRALYAVAFEAGELFPSPERETARAVLLRQALAIMARLELPSPTRGEASTALEAFVAHLDAAGPEERRTSEWIVQRAAVGRALEPLVAVPAGASDPLVETVRGAFEAISRPGARSDGAPVVAPLRDMPLLGTAYLSPDMLLVGLAAIARAGERTVRPATRRGADRKRDEDDEGFLIRPLEADWESVADPTAAIENWEAASGETLPADYRAFLKTFNGGRIYPNMFAYSVPLTGASSTGAMTFLDRLHDWAHVEAVSGGEMFGDRFPPGFLAIGCDPGGMEILLSLRAEDHGAAFCWLHDDEPWGSPRNAHVHWLAASFDDFVDGLRDVAERAGRRYWDRPALRRLVRRLDY